jgi:hypothetical protein
MSIYANQNDALPSEIQTTTESVELLTSATIEAEEPINTTPAYVYRLICKPTGQFYYGLRYANIKKYRMPEDDLWIYYFSSSDPVDELVEIYGKDSFDYKVIFQSTDIEQAYLFEQTIIKAYWGNPQLLNLQYKDPITGGKMWAGTKESNEKAAATRRERGTNKKNGARRRADGSSKRIAQKGVETRRARGTDKIGIQKGIETKRRTGSGIVGAKKAVATKKATGVDKIAVEKSNATKKATGSAKLGARKAIETKRKKGTLQSISQKGAATRKATGMDKIAHDKSVATKQANGSYHTGGIKSAETRAKRGKDAEGSQYWQLTKPDGDVIIIKNLLKFCRENKLSNVSMRKCSYGTQLHHRGWKCKKLEKQLVLDNTTDDLMDN